MKKTDPLNSEAAPSLPSEEMARKYRFIADSLKESVTMIDRNYVYQAANETYCKAQGKRREEIVGRFSHDQATAYHAAASNALAEITVIK